jgi:hypothetical protein
LYKIGGRLYKLTPFGVLGPCRVGGLPLQNRSGREALLVHLLGIVLDHVARLPGGCRRLGVGASGSSRNTTADFLKPWNTSRRSRRAAISGRFNSSCHAALTPSRVQALSRELVRIVPLNRCSDNAAVDAAFFPGGQVKLNVLINIGYRDAEKLFPRSPRLAFDEIATIV